jgi:hypothetical protein
MIPTGRRKNTDEAAMRSPVWYTYFLHMTLKRSIYCVSFVWLVGASACTATVTTGGAGAQCSIDGAVAGCAANASGYSCSGGQTPEQTNASLLCSTGTTGTGGATLYCCVTGAFTSNTCGADASVRGCIDSSIGFSCTSDNRPEQTDSSLVCSTGTPDPSGATLYCCNTTGSAPTTTAACAADPNVVCMTAGSTGYSCPTGLPPLAPLTCGAGVTESGGNAMGFCCTTTTTTVPTCAQDANVACTTAGTVGYTCSGGATPLAPLTCGAGVPESGGATGYCCSSGTGVSSTCGPNGTVSCTSGFTGYSCTGPDTPWQAMSSLLCEPSATLGSGGYCCVISANSCVQAPSIIDCPSGYYGVTCGGADTAMAANSSLLCASDPNGGASQFCCTGK